MIVFHVLLPSCSKVTHVQQWFPTLAFMYQDSPDSLNIFTILNIVVGKLTGFFCSFTLRNTSLELTDDCLMRFGRIVSPELSLLGKPKPLIDTVMLLLNQVLTTSPLTN